MDLSSSGLHDRLGNLSKNELSPQKDKEEFVQSKPAESGDSQEQMVQRCVIIQRDEKGYGLTVSGDNPVFVQSVKEDGAAARAGVQQGDRIIKVNGTLVTQSNHQEVVELIKSGSYVALTLLGKPPGHGRTSSGTLQPLNLSGSNQSHQAHNTGSKLSSPSERITGPQPVDPEKQQQLTNSRIHTIRKMLEKEVIYLENLRLEFSKTPSDKIRTEVNGAMKRVKTLEEQLHNLTGVHHDQIVPRSPKSPPPPGRHYHSEKENFRSISSPVPIGIVHQGRALTHQISAPILPKSERFPAMMVHTGDSSEPVSPSTVSLSQQEHDVEGHNPFSTQKQSLSTSLENIAKQLNSRSTTWPQAGPTHSRQSSSPETLLHHVESMRYQRHEGSKLPSSETLCRSHSEASQHAYSRKCRASESLLEAEVRKRRRPTNSSRGSSIGQYDSAIESPPPTPPRTPPECAEDLSEFGESFEGDDNTLQEEYGTPPESQNSSDVNMHSVAAKLGQNPSIICMEDDEFSSDTEMGHLEDHGPFNGLWKLVRNPAHLAVFMHYLMSNSDPSSLFFYLITDMYEQGTSKEMKKWAYEIHSSFLVPGAPLKVANVDETILHEIDDVLLNHIEKEEVLRAVFRKARKKAREELNDLLADFRNKRTMGLGNIFGPPDYQLEEAIHDKNKELKIIDQLLVPGLENLSEDLENVNDRLAAKALALATLLKQFGVKNPQALNFVDRCPTFVAKEKTRLRFLQRNKKVMFVHGHHFVPQHYYSVTYCNHCQLIIWGVGNQGYQCQNCEMNIHKSCVKVVEEHCIGSLRNKKDKKKDRMSGIMENIIGKTRKPSHPVPAAIERAKKLNEEWNLESGLSSLPNASNTENLSETGDRCNSEGKAEKVNLGNEVLAQQTLQLRDDIDRTNFNKKSTSIGRSESFRQRRESRPSFRKRSDPNIPRSKSDVEVDDKSVSNLNNSGSSSNSSLSNRSLDSPSNSSEMVHRTPTVTSADSVPTGSIPATGAPSSHASTPSTVHHYDDSDLEAEPDPPNWQESVDWEVLRLMKPKEKKRQDVINELFHTEKTHVRNLKVLDKLFYKPLQQEQLLPVDFLQLLFPNLEEMLEIHSNFNSKMKAQRKEEPIIGNIGELLLDMFNGPAGEHLKKAAATYCQNQSVALESLKVRQRKDQKLAQFLADAEVHNLCRRLQLKDIIASGFQRLTKYPLLLENIAKYTPPNTEELSHLLRAVECSKEILVYVDSAVKDAENLHRLTDIQKKLDKTAFEKVENPIVHSFKNLDVTKHRLLHEGPLTWRLNKQKTVDMHVVLLEEALVLLQKQDDKYILKFHNSNLTSGRDDTKIMHSPILRCHKLLIRNNATDKRSIFLISPSELHAMYEFVAATPSEKKIWCRYLTEAVEVNKLKYPDGGLNKQPEPTPSVPDNTLPSGEESTEDLETGNKECVNEEEPELQEQRDFNGSLELPDTLQSNQAASVSPVAPLVPVAPTDSQHIEDATQASNSEEVSNSESQQKPQRRLQRVEILKIADGPQLIEPCEVIVSHGAILQTAEPVLTPIEKLRRKDQQIASAIQEKQNLVADILQIPSEDFEHIAELAEEMEEEKDAHELVLASISQANRLALHLNESLNVTEEDTISASSIEVMPDSDSNATTSSGSFSLHSPKISRKHPKLPGVPPDKLLTISSALNKHLTQLLAIITEIEEERKQLRKELHNSREQLHLLHEAHRHCTIRSQSPSNHSICQSRPSSFISISSSMSEGVPELPDHQPLFSVLEKTSEESGVVSAQTTDVLQTKLQSDTEQSYLNQENLSQETENCHVKFQEPSELINLADSCDHSKCPVTDLDSELEMTQTTCDDIHSEQLKNENEDCFKDKEAIVADQELPVSSKLSSNSETSEKSVDAIYF